MPQLNARVFPTLRFISITKSVRRSRAVQNYQLPKVVLAIQYMPQSRTQRRDACAHRHQHQIVATMSIEIKPVTGYAQQIDAVALFHVKERDTCAGGSLDEDFQFAIFGRAGESKVNGLFTVHSEHGNLARNERDSM